MDSGRKLLSDMPHPPSPKDEGKRNEVFQAEFPVKQSLSQRLAFKIFAGISLKSSGVE